jgi:hypothetical protein
VNLEGALLKTTIQQDLALLSELDTSIQLLQVGCREVQSIDGGNAFYHVAMLSLANGLERLLKATICLASVTSCPFWAAPTRRRPVAQTRYLLSKTPVVFFRTEGGRQGLRTSSPVI